VTALQRKSRRREERVPKPKRKKGATWTPCIDPRGKSKRRYPTREHARAGALGLMLGGSEKDRLPRQTITVFACRWCGGYHVGHDRTKLTDKDGNR